MSMESAGESSITSPIGRGRIAATMQRIVGAIRVRGYGLSIDRTPLTPTLSPWERERTSVATTSSAQLEQSREILKVSE
jgi:hypothetical protein